MAIRRISAHVHLSWEEDQVYLGFWKGFREQEGPKDKRTGKLRIHVGTKSHGYIECTYADAHKMQYPDDDAYIELDAGNGRWMRWFKGHWYWDSEDHEPDVAKALIEAHEIRKRQSIDRAKTLASKGVSTNSSPRRESIPTDLRVLVWERDGGKCVQCDSGEDLQFDHIIPVAMGGATSDQNLQILCGSCNRSKGASLG